MKVVIPLAGSNPLGDERPLPLVEILNKTVIEYVVANLAFGIEAEYVFIVRKEDCQKHHLDAVIDLVAPGSKIVRLEGETRGQLCSCLMAIEHVADDEELLIVNGNQFVFDDIKGIVGNFAQSGADGGLVTFPNIHPRWSFVRLDNDGETVVETSEKRPISRNACVGIFWYRRGEDFINSAKEVIRKRNEVGGLYYVSSTYNSMILDGKRVVAHEIDGEAFCGLHSKDGVLHFASVLQEKAW